MLIRVTQAHLDAAEARHGMICCNCPVARAIQEQTPFHVRVGLTVVNFYEQNLDHLSPAMRSHYLDLPDAAIKIRDAYDFHTPITGEFELPLETVC